MRIHLPNSAFLGNIDPFLRSIDTTKPNILEITANKKWISIHPMALAMVAALGLTMRSGDVHFEKLEAKSKHYLERMGLFKILGLKSGIKVTEHESAGRFIPLTKITDTDELSQIIKEVIPILHLMPEKAAPLKYIISELVRNVFEHAGSKNGAILCAQFYKKSDTVRIGIIDTGVGIRKTISASHKTASDMGAILLALTPGITGATERIGGTDYNAGAGLFFIKSLAKASRDFFVIYSGSAMYKLLKSGPKSKSLRLHGDPLKDRHSQDDTLPRWQGTAVGIDISLGQSPEFLTLLDFIRDTYARAIRDQKKEKYRKAKFI